MRYTPQELVQISARTLLHYDRHAQRFREGTQDHDVRQNIAALLDHIVGTPPFASLSRMHARRDASHSRGSAIGRSASTAPRRSSQWRAKPADAKSGSRIS